MESIVSTLNTPDLTTRRGHGNSTRQINFAIENLFKGNIVLIQDHHNSDRFINNDLLLKRIQKRLYEEHNLTHKDYTISKTDKNCYSVKLNYNAS